MEKKKATKIEKQNQNRIAVFIDAANLWSSYKSMGMMLDMNKITPYLTTKFGGQIYKIFYYVAYPKDGTREKDKLNKLHNFFVFLEKRLKFEVIKKPLKTILLRNSEGEVIIDAKTNKPASKEKGNLDVEIAMDVMKFNPAFTIAIFFTGDSDFLPLISHLRNLKIPKKVYIFSTKDCVAEELKTGSDGYFDLIDCYEMHQCKLLSRENMTKQLTPMV